MKTISAAVRVTLQVDVYVGNWDAKTTFMDLREQAIREAKLKLGNALAKQGQEISVVDEPVAMRVILNGDLKP
jgi:hypothetical protein